jgi:hypothetical protein
MSHDDAQDERSLHPNDPNYATAEADKVPVF